MRKFRCKTFPYIFLSPKMKLFSVSFVGVATLTLLVGCVNASLNLHGILLRHLMRNPMEFFDVTPLGRIVNRIAKDIDIVDNVLPMTFRMFLTGLCVVNYWNQFDLIWALPSVVDLHWYWWLCICSCCTLLYCFLLFRCIVLALGYFLFCFGAFIQWYRYKIFNNYVCYVTIRI